MSNTISRFEKYISTEWPYVDTLGHALLGRVTALLARRTDLSRPEFGRRVGRGHSWISEFFAGLRTTNDLRLVVKIARVFGVSVSYLLGEDERQRDEEIVTLLGAWPALDERSRRAVLNLALMLKQETADPGSAPPPAPPSVPPAAGGTTKGPKKRR